MTQTKIIIYDFDGTIADSLAMAIQTYNEIAKEKGFKYVTEAKLEALRGQTPRAVLKELGVNLYQAPRLLHRVLKEVKHIVASLNTQPGMKDLLYQAREAGFKQAILTTNLEENVKAFLLKNDIDIFDYLYCGSSPFGKDKFLKRLIKDAGYDAREAVYVGDEARDIEAAKKAGMDIICVDWGYNTRHILEQNRPTAVVSKPEEILEILQAA